MGHLSGLGFYGPTRLKWASKQNIFGLSPCCFAWELSMYQVPAIAYTPFQQELLEGNDAALPIYDQVWALLAPLEAVRMPPHGGHDSAARWMRRRSRTAS